MIANHPLPQDCFLERGYSVMVDDLNMKYEITEQRLVTGVGLLKITDNWDMTGKNARKRKRVAVG